MEKIIIDINLVDRSFARHCRSKDDPNSDWFNNWIECVRVIKTRCLMEFLKNQVCLVSLEVAICIELGFVYPFTVNKI